MSRRIGGLFAVLAAGLLAGCGGEPAGSGGHLRVAEGTPVVLISVDTLRSDRLPMYGYGEVETPALDALRADSILFEHAYAHVPMTLPSHASLLSGLLPPGHGVRDNLGYRLEAESHPWLPRVLADAGYRTGAGVSSFVLRAATGMAAGFELYEDRILQRSWEIGEAERAGTSTLAATRDWLRSVGHEPFFFLFHTYEPHQPLTPPEPFASLYDSAYDAEVAAADAVVGELLAELRELGAYDRAVVLFTSDHGEGLGDHGLVEHGPLLYREQIQVPLLLKLPGSEQGGSSVSAPVQLTDVVPTVLSLLGLEVPEDLPGASLLALASTGGEEASQRPIFAETFYPRAQYGWSELTSVIRFPWHLIQGPEPELYHLAEDPEQTRNVLQEERRAYAAARDALRGYDGSYEVPTRTEDPTVRQRLAALGYLGGGERGTAESLADPKSKLPILAELGRGAGLARSGALERSVEVFRNVLAHEPGLTAAWEQLGTALMGLGRPQEALEAYREQIRLSGGSSLAALNAAGALLRLGRLEEAEEHALLAAEDGYPQAHDLLAQTALRRDDLDAAEAWLGKALAGESGQPGPRITEAELLLRRGRPEESLERIGQVEELLAQAGEIDGSLIRGLHLVKGEALARLGEAEEAARAFAREIELYPHELAPYTRLAVLFALTDQGAASARVLQRMVEANPTPAAYLEAARTMRVLGDPAAADRLLAAARQRWPESPVLRPAGAG